MPHGLAARGALRRNNTSNLEVRILGLIWASAVLWVVLNIALSRVEPQTAGRVRAVLGAAVCAGIAGNGLSMLLWPRFWLERFVVEGGPRLDASLTVALVWCIRFLSVVVIVAGAYGVWRFIGPTG